MSILRRSMGIAVNRGRTLVAESEGIIINPSDTDVMDDSTDNFSGTSSVIEINEINALENQVKDDLRLTDMAEKSSALFHEAASYPSGAPESIVAKADLLAEQIADETNQPVADLVPYINNTERTIIVAGESMYPAYASLRLDRERLTICGESMADFAKKTIDGAIDTIVALFDKLSQFLNKYFGSTAKLYSRFKKIKEKANKTTGNLSSDKIQFTGEKAALFCIPDIEYKPMYLNNSKSIVDYVEISKHFSSDLVDFLLGFKRMTESSREIYDKLTGGDNVDQFITILEIRNKLIDKNSDAIKKTYGSGVDKYTKLVNSTKNIEYHPLIPLPNYSLLIYARAKDDFELYFKDGAVPAPDTDTLVSSLKFKNITSIGSFDILNYFFEKGTISGDYNGVAVERKKYRDLLEFKLKNKTAFTKYMSLLVIYNKLMYSISAHAKNDPNGPEFPKTKDPFNLIKIISQLVDDCSTAMISGIEDTGPDIRNADPSGKVAIKKEIDIAPLTNGEISDICSSVTNVLDDYLAYEKSKGYIENAKAARKLAEYSKKVSANDSNNTDTKISGAMRRIFKSILDSGLKYQKLNGQLIVTINRFFAAIAELCEKSLSQYSKD